MEIQFNNVTKSYPGVQVLNHVSLSFTSGNTYCLTSPSGSGKTTLLRLLLGLEQPDSGEITGIGTGVMTAVFQENRLPEPFTPIEQILMVSPRGYTAERARDELLRILPEECLTRPISTLSGGMKRRVAICRALAFPFDCCLMDEPFTGLDEVTKHKVIAYVKKKTGGKLLIVSTHQEEDISLLGGSALGTF